MQNKIILFGEAEKGSFTKPHLLKSPFELSDQLGNPPKESLGIFFGIQALLFERELLFFRVREEGFSYEDYFKGIQILKEKLSFTENLSAICIPGVGNKEIIRPLSSIAKEKRGFLITTEKDLYDYLTSLRFP
jgi:hypothetical protein